jgi:hypothetical protein
MSQVIKVSVKNVYGRETVYPECEKAKLFCKLTNTVTLTEDACFYIEQLGYTFELINKTKFRDAS